MLSLIVPSYNEGARIYGNLSEIARSLGDMSFEILAVNDGSADNTGDEIARAAAEDPRIVPVSYEVNRGKGGAIKEGISRSKGDLVGFLDADLDISPAHVPVYVRAFDEGDCDVVIASKMHKESKLDYPFIRKVFSVGYFCLMKMLFGTGLKDTQTGLKIYRGDLLRDVAPKMKVDGYAFDIEMLMLSVVRGAKIREMPVEIDFKRGNSLGRIRMRDIWKMWRDTWKIWWDLRIAKRY